LTRDSKHWVAAVVKGGEERRIACHLSENHSIECYHPTIVKWRKLPKHEAVKQGRNRALFSFPLLPGYLFVAAHDNQDLSDLLRSKNVYGVVRTSSGPCYARDSEIQILRKLEAEYGSVKHVEPTLFETISAKLAELAQAHQQGRHLRLTSGPFEGLLATLRNSSVANGQVGLSLNGKNVTAPIDSVEVA